MARRQGWRVLLRLEDLDTPRVKAGAAAGQIEILRWLGLDWDEEPTFQSADLEPYRAAMEVLAERGLVYPCSLSRKEIERAASAPHAGEHETHFPPSLRPDGAGQPRCFADQGTNWRFMVPDGTVEFDDAFMGKQSHNPAQTVGDFVVWTKRGQPAYQLAVVVDDHAQGVTQVVRGGDLLDSAARQMQLYRAMNLTPEPTYTHLPMVIGPDGRRLAKRHGDTRLTMYRELGTPPERIIALLARWSGIEGGGAGGEAMSARDFADGLDLSTMSADPVVFTQEDDRWLRTPTS
jgi:glutamyl-tRNA synthetase